MSFTWDELDAMRPKGSWRLPLPPTCRKCAYNLTGLRDNRCPECGTPFNWREVHKRASWTWAMALRIRHANQDATMGIVLGLGGWFAVGLVHLIGSVSLMVLIDFMAGLAALMTIVLGSQVLNVRRIPKWARACIGDSPPSMALGTLAMLLGLSLLAAVVVSLTTR